MAKFNVGKFVREVRAETNKIVWPTVRETNMTAIMVLIMTAILAVFFLGIDSLFCVIGGSLGGMQALQWAASYPKRVFSCVPLATAARHSAQNIAFYEVGRQAIMADPDWRGGDYEKQGVRPDKGLAVARMGAHITYLSESALHEKFDRGLQDREKISFSFDADFQVESYLRHQGSSFTDRFDANSYLYLSRAMDGFDLAADFGNRLSNAFQAATTRHAVFAFTSDWRYPVEESREIARALIAAGALSRTLPQFLWPDHECI